MLKELDLAVEMGAECVTAMVGPRGDIPWDVAADRLVDQTIAVLPEIHARNLRLATEPVQPLRQDVSFINLASDIVDIVRAVNDPSFGYIFDTWHLWWQRDIEEVARESADQIFVVQVSDHKAMSMRTQDRAMPGGGIIPLRRLLQALVDGGYTGWWELEVLSDDNEKIGFEKALEMGRRSLSDLWTSPSLR
jgi:sugar phosphate isomerase/epimerase